MLAMKIFYQLIWSVFVGATLWDSGEIAAQTAFVEEDDPHQIHAKTVLKKAEKQVVTHDSNPQFTVQMLKMGDRVSAEIALAHAIEVAYFGAMYGKGFDGSYYFDQPTEIEHEAGQISLTRDIGRSKIHIIEDRRVLIQNSTVVCPPTSTKSCNVPLVFETITLKTEWINSTGLSGKEDGSDVIIPAMYEYGLYNDAPGLTPGFIQSGLQWVRARQHDKPQEDQGDFYAGGYIPANKTQSNFRTLLLKTIELTGNLKTTDSLHTDPLDSSAVDSVHFKITACAHAENDPSTACERKELGPFGYSFLVENIHHKGLDDLLCRFNDPTAFCLITLGLDKLQIHSIADFAATPGAYTNVYENINGLRREARTDTHYLPSL